jgi:hypothetical protein
VDGGEVSAWFDEYLAAFAACGRGEAETASLLAHYGVPLMVTTDDGDAASRCWRFTVPDTAPTV